MAKDYKPEDIMFPDQKIVSSEIVSEMKTSYIDYAMSVIAARALPDVRDGLKPVQRRVLYSMVELNNGPDKPHRKSARIVGDTMGKYHPHGDTSIYGALVNMAQHWSMRYMLVDGHGNFGSVDGDEAAAMRYTEARLSKISTEMIFIRTLWTLFPTLMKQKKSRWSCRPDFQIFWSTAEPALPSAWPPISRPITCGK